ncbi:WD40-repeat-containing domain protein [Lentinula raphanica]|nr:WD40-repeat-containing domain protein [Lentinula raphanica]
MSRAILKKAKKSLFNKKEAGSNVTQAPQAPLPIGGTDKSDLHSEHRVVVSRDQADQVNETGRIVADNVHNVLKFLKEVSAPFPPLQAVAGGLCECLNIYKKISGNTEQLDALAKSIASNEAFLTKFLTQEELQLSDIPATQDLANKLKIICEEVVHYQKMGLRSRAVQLEVISNKIGYFQKRIQDACEQCKLEILFTIERKSTAILKELIFQKLKYSYQAFYDTDTGTRKFCSPDTRREILSEIKQWTLNFDSDPVYWMSGLAGTGKSTIAMSICKTFEEENILAANFFCSHQIPECNNYQYIIPTLSYQLARFSKTFAIALGKHLSADPDIVYKSPKNQINKLLIAPWKSAQEFDKKESSKPIIVIDALDECTDAALILEPLVAAVQNNELSGLKFFITSRPEQEIQKLLSFIVTEQSQSVLHNVEEELVKKDIYTYVKAELSGVFTTEEQLHQLTALAGRLFIYAATVVKFVKGVSGVQRRKQRLIDFLVDTSHSEDLRHLYTQVIQHAIPKDKLMQKEFQEDWKIIHTIISAQRPLTCNTLANLQGLKISNVLDLVHRLHALLYISDQDHTILSLHASFPEFVTTYKGVTYDPTSCHDQLSSTSFEIMKRQLRFNICNLSSSYIPDNQIPNLDTRLEENVGETLKYCCHHWSFHFLHCSISEELLIALEKFLIEKGVFWIETMSLFNALTVCGNSLNALTKYQYWVDSSRGKIIQKLAAGLHALLKQYASSDAQGMTPHLYLSIIPFWINHSTYQPIIKKCIKQKSNVSDWLTYHAVTLKTVATVNSVIFTPDGSKIIAGINDNMIYVWDATTGIQIGKLKGHTGHINAVACSPDGSKLLSGSDDRTIRVWNIETGSQILQPLHGHKLWVSSVSFSPDGSKIASGSGDKKLKLWNVINGRQIGRSLRGHTNWINSVAFSPDGTKLVSSSDDNTVRIWNVITGTQVGNPLSGHEQGALTAILSPDGTQIVSGSGDWTIRFWSATTGIQIGPTLKVHEGWVSAIAFSIDGTKFITGSNDNLLKLWDSETKTQIGASWHGHEDCVNSVAFAPNGTQVVSGSRDQTIKIWDTTLTNSVNEHFEPGHTGLVTSAVFSPDGTQIASSSGDDTIRIWDSITGMQIGKPLEGHEDIVNSVAYSSDGKMLVSGSNDMTVRLWDINKGIEVHQPFEGHEGWITTVSFAPDGTKVVSGSFDMTLRIWDTATGLQIGEPLQGHEDWIQSVVFSPDGTKILSGSKDQTIIIWDSITDKTIKVWDANTKKQLGTTLQGHDDWVSSVAFSPDGTRIVSASFDKTIRSNLSCSTSPVSPVSRSRTLRGP